VGKGVVPKQLHSAMLYRRCGFSGFIADFGYLVRLKEACRQKCIVLVFWIGRVKKILKAEKFFGKIYLMYRSLCCIVTCGV